MRVNVVTIGHVEHGKANLTQALVKVLGADTASEVVVVDEQSVEDLRRKGLIHDAVTETIESCYSDLFGRAKNPSRKKARKDRLRAAMYKAAGGRK